MVKLDFEKAYDSVDHSFLDCVMKEMGFGLRWRNWMYWCISSPVMSEKNTFFGSLAQSFRGRVITGHEHCSEDL